jgi:small subunit ribosomal protein S16
MLTIKLQRIGKKHQPSFRIVVAEGRSKLGAPPVEDLGSYSAFTKKGELIKERVLHWLKMGAQPTVSAHNLLVRLGALQAKKTPIKLKKSKKESSAPAAPVAAAPEVKPADAAAA